MMANATPKTSVRKCLPNTEAARMRSHCAKQDLPKNTSGATVQQVQSQERPVEAESWDSYKQGLTRHYACNAYIDREIGRVVDAVERLHEDDTTIIYTSDHGGMQGSHGLSSKGPMMYEEICNIPFIVKHPSGKKGVATSALLSHIDIIPTMLELAGIERPDVLHGTSFAPLLLDPEIQIRKGAMINFYRFAINTDNNGEFYPIRGFVNKRFKLAINLLETDEFYDLENDPSEMNNLIDDPRYVDERNSIHDAILDEMDRIRDPFRSYRWGDRPWHSVRVPFYRGGKNRPRPNGFPFQAQAPP